MSYTTNTTDAQEFLKKFPKLPKEFYKEKMAMETVDLKLDNLESFKYVNPKKYSEEKIYWHEERDIQLYWKHKENAINLIMGLSFGILILLLLSCM